jgi:hypothetical protein
VHVYASIPVEKLLTYASSCMCPRNATNMRVVCIFNAALAELGVLTASLARAACSLAYSLVPIHVTCYRFIE